MIFFKKRSEELGQLSNAYCPARRHLHFPVPSPQQALLDTRHKHRPWKIIEHLEALGIHHIFSSSMGSTSNMYS